MRVLFYDWSLAESLPPSTDWVTARALLDTVKRRLQLLQMRSLRSPRDAVFR